MIFRASELADGIQITTYIESLQIDSSEFNSIHVHITCRNYLHINFTNLNAQFKMTEHLIIIRINT